MPGMLKYRRGNRELRFVREVSHIDNHEYSRSGRSVCMRVCLKDFFYFYYIYLGGFHSGSLRYFQSTPDFYLFLLYPSDLQSRSHLPRIFFLYSGENPLESFGEKERHGNDRVIGMVWFGVYATFRRHENRIVLLCSSESRWGIGSTHDQSNEATVRRVCKSFYENQYVGQPIIDLIVFYVTF